MVQDAYTYVPAPADLPDSAVLLPVSEGGAPRLRQIVGAVRPDIRFAADTAELGAGAWLIATGPRWLDDLRRARARGLRQPALVVPEAPTSYFDYWSFPVEMLRPLERGALAVRLQDLVAWIISLGDFFGRVGGRTYFPEPERYLPLRRASPGAVQRSERVLRLLGDDASRADLAAVLMRRPEELWQHWLSNLYNGIEYMDYATLTPGDVVINCGVHGGGELPNFLAAMQGRGCIINADPLGEAYLSGFVREAMEHCPATHHEYAVAVHDCVTTLDLPVESGGMALGDHLGGTLPGCETRTFQATTIDAIVEEVEPGRVDLIKMDIEGAEPRALVGATKTIDRFRPQLAISIYHRPDHFCDLPLMLAERLQSYDLYVRQYHFISNETIVYAIPRERARRGRSSRIRVALLP